MFAENSDTIMDDNDYELIALSQGYFAKVDIEDVDMINQFSWSISAMRGTVYAKTSLARTNGARKNIYMHRMIMNVPKGMETDHINHDGLDNRKKNLRKCTRRQNMLNIKTINGKSKYRGVSKHRNRWRARTKAITGKSIFLGSFHKEQEAAIAYDDAIISTGEDIAYLNFPERRKNVLTKKHKNINDSESRRAG